MRLSGDCAELVEQLQAVETLWDKLQQQWLSSRRCSAKYVVAKRQDKDKAQVSVACRLWVVGRYPGVLSIPAWNRLRNQA